MILFGSSFSPFVRKVLAFAAEKQIELEVRPIRLRDEDPEFRAASPFAQMPALADGDYCLADSSAICHYLDALRPEPELIPSEPRERGQAVWFDEFADTILFGCGRTMFFNRVVAPHFLKTAGNETAAESALRDELPPILDYLERVVPDEGGFLVSERLTLADIAVASPFVNFMHAGVELDRGKYPRTRAYVERILERPSFTPWIERETALLAKVAA